MKARTSVLIVASAALACGQQAVDPPALAWMFGEPIAASFSGYAYTVTPFASVTQRTSSAGYSLGTYVGWVVDVADAQCPSGTRHKAQRYSGGTPCSSTGAPRSSTVTWSCSDDGSVRVTSSVESPTCVYAIAAETNCGEDGLALCVPVTPSQTPSPSGSASVTATSSASLSVGAPPSTSRSVSATPSASATSELVATALLVDLRAADYVPGAWKNRATPEPPSRGIDDLLNNGDFAATGVVASWPVLTTVAGVQAVVFNATSAATAQYVVADTAYPGFAGLYGSSDWSYEAWVLHAGIMASNAHEESPVLQWSPRPGSLCDSAFTSVGTNPVYGAGGHWECDVAFGPSPSTTVAANGGYMPSVGEWHHFALTYTGGTVGTESLYVDGVLNLVVTGRSLDIIRGGLMYLGSRNGAQMWGGNVAIGALRLHDGCLTAVGVAARYALEVDGYLRPLRPSLTQTPASTATSSASVSIGSSPSTTPSVSAIATPTPPATPTPGLEMSVRLVGSSAAGVCCACAVAHASLSHLPQQLAVGIRGRTLAAGALRSRASTTRRRAEPSHRFYASSMHPSRACSELRGVVRV